MNKPAAITEIKLGRPTAYTHEIAEEICERLAEGETLRSICRSDHMPVEAAVRKWAIDDREGFYAHYTAARNLGLDCMADQILAVAEDGSDDDFDPKTGKINQESYQRSRLRVDSMKWYLSKLAPKRYGDRLTNVHTGPEGGAIRLSAMSDEELNDRLTELQDSSIKSLPSPEKDGNSE